MKSCYVLTFLLAVSFCQAQQDLKTRNIFIVTTDGFRWQEVFTGADSSLINNNSLVADTSLLKSQFWDANPLQRRKKLMPFLWNVVAQQGQLYGNRNYNNYVNCKNLYKISYPGYNELFAGFADPRLIPNTPVYNKNINILEFLNKSERYKGKVVAFTSWNIFPFILNEDRSGILVNSGYENMKDDADSSFSLINAAQDNVNHRGHTRYDLLTFLNAMEYVKRNKPHVVFIGLGETDEFAHSKRYDLYLQQAANADRMIAELWYYIQTDPFYKDSTTLIITTDHGRGKSSSNWYMHSILTAGSGQAWMAILGPDCAPEGEIRTKGRLYQNQVAATMAWLLGMKFESDHKVGLPVNMAIKDKVNNPSFYSASPTVNLETGKR